MCTKNRKMSNSKRFPELITDHVNNMTLVREHYLGKGGFGRCFALKNITTGKKYAGKFLNKKELSKYNLTNKILQEINIHKDLVHVNIVGFENYIEENDFIYIILELCDNRSMSELINRRRCVRTFEAKYYMKQVVSGITYLHERHVIHRDLKLANLFINNKMVIKIGDFGLAVKVDEGKQNRRSLCGTPNYIAPEVLSRQGHSYAVDVWALGCILYTLLVGNPPFQTETIDGTYSLIAKCDYKIPEMLKNSTAAHFIKNTLQKDPNKRPSIGELSKHDFLHIGFIPRRLPSSCMVMPPRSKTLMKEYLNRRLFSSVQQNSNETITQSKLNLNDVQLTVMIQTLYDKVSAIVTNGFVSNNIDDTQNPSLRPFIWINSWMNYTSKYGFSYRLNDNTVGILFNDSTTLLILPSGKNVHYFDSECNESYYSIDDMAKQLHLKKKMKVLKSCREFIFSSLRNAYVEEDEIDVEPLSSLPILKNLLNTENIVGMFLSNGTLQLNFAVDHVKLIFCPVTCSVTVVTYDNQRCTFELNLLKKYGCNELLLNKLNQSISIIVRILNIRKPRPNSI